MERPQVCVHTCARVFRSVCVLILSVWAGLHPGMVSWGPMDVSPQGPKGSLSPLSAALSAPGPSVAPWGEATAEHPSQRVCKTPNYRDDRSDPSHSDVHVTDTWQMHFLAAPGGMSVDMQVTG